VCVPTNQQLWADYNYIVKDKEVESVFMNSIKERINFELNNSEEVGRPLT